MQGFSAVITNHCSALCKALRCGALSPASRHWPAWRGRGETAPCHQHMHLENIFMYPRRMIVTILFYSAVDLCRTCSLVTLRQLLAVPGAFKCFISGGIIYPLSLRKSIFSTCTKTQSKAITFHCRCIFLQVDIYAYM